MHLVHEVTDRLTKPSFGPLPPALFEPLEIELPLLFVLETRVRRPPAIFIHPEYAAVLITDHGARREFYFAEVREEEPVVIQLCPVNIDMPLRRQKIFLTGGDESCCTLLENEVDSQNFALVKLAAELNLGEICYGRVKSARIFPILGRVNPAVSGLLKMADDEARLCTERENRASPHPR